MDGSSGIVDPAAFAELLKLAHVPLPLANAWLMTLLLRSRRRQRHFKRSRLTRRGTGPGRYVRFSSRSHLNGQGVIDRRPNPLYTESQCELQLRGR